MNRFSLSHLTAAAMVVSVALMAGAILTVSPTPSQAAKGGKGKGGGQPPTPAKITFCNDDTGNPACDPSGHEITSDGGPYEDGIFADLEVTIDSAANQGNIRLEGDNSVRTLRITVPANDCGLPTGETPLTSNFDFQSLGVGVDKEVDGGVFGMAVGESGSVIVPMGIRFGYPVLDGDLFFLFYATDLKGPDPCKGKSGLVKVVRNTDTSWTVTDDGTACVQNHPEKGKAIVCFTGTMNFSFDVECLDENNCPPGP